MKINRLVSLLAAVLLGSSAIASAADFPSRYPAPPSGQRLTPAETPAPEFHGPSLFGARPGSPILAPLSVSGERPMKFSVDQLPRGLRLNVETGVFTGKIKRPGNYDMTVAAENRHGRATRRITLRIGNEICLTPPMGWSSWYSYSRGVSQENILKTARLLVESGLADYGYRYVNIDDCWQGERGGKYRAIQPNHRFPDMKSLCRDIHRLGLKAGIYSTPWMGTYAGYIGGSMPNEKGDYSELALPLPQRNEPNQLFGDCPGTERRGAGKVGPVWMVDKDIRQWAEWGFDFVKMDWYPNDVPNTARIAHDLKKADRDIVLSLSNSAPFDKATSFSSLAHMWRTTGDIADTWGSVRQIASEQGKWQPLTRMGHWNDPDMLQIGRLGRPGKSNSTFAPTRLTPDEQYYQMTFWAMMSAPLIISCDLEQIDDFTRGILCNGDVVSVNQQFFGPARLISEQNDGSVWIKPLQGKRVAVGFFNASDAPQMLSVSLSELGFCSPARARDAWRQSDVGTVRDRMNVELNPHGASLFILTPEK